MSYSFVQAFEKALQVLKIERDEYHLKWKVALTNAGTTGFESKNEIEARLNYQIRKDIIDKLDSLI